MAFRYSNDGQIGAFKNSKFFNWLKCILRTSWIKSAWRGC